MAFRAPEPTDAALADYIRSRLQEIGSVFADPEVVNEALTYHRDLWARLYAIDHAEPPHESAGLP